MLIAKNMESKFIQLIIIINIEGIWGDTVDFMGCVEAKLSLPIGNKMFETNALFVCSSYHRVPQKVFYIY